MNILLVEDDPVISRNICDAMQAESYSVEQAYDGAIAERMLRKSEYDCVILDVNIPGKNGFQVCKAFRQFNQHTPVIFLTAFDELEDKVEGFDSGADDYLTKPFFTKELLMRVRSLVNRGKSSRNPNGEEVIVVEDVVVNQKQKTVKRSDTEIVLTPREYQILLKLVSARGALVSKQELIKEIWGSAFDANTNTIEVYINFLRNKFDKPFGKQLIKTKVGYGYYLDVNA
ncbi:MAG: response regulator transcription factor [Bacteroidota bacterium]